MVLSEKDLELYCGPKDAEVSFNYKSKLFNATWDKMKGSIKPCPHCGSTKFRMKDTRTNDCRYIAVICSDCKSVGPRSKYQVWTDLNDAWHLYDENTVDTTKEAVVGKAIDLWNNTSN